MGDAGASEDGVPLGDFVRAASSTAFVELLALAQRLPGQLPLLADGALAVHAPPSLTAVGPHP